MSQLNNKEFNNFKMEAIKQHHMTPAEACTVEDQKIKKLLDWVVNNGGKH
jgi:hypothetical protein